MAVLDAWKAVLGALQQQNSLDWGSRIEGRWSGSVIRDQPPPSSFYKKTPSLPTRTPFPLFHTQHTSTTSFSCSSINQPLHIQKHDQSIIFISINQASSNPAIRDSSIRQLSSLTWPFIFSILHIIFFTSIILPSIISLSLSALLHHGARKLSRSQDSDRC